MSARPFAAASALALAYLLTACQQADDRSARANQAIPAQTLALMQQKGMSQADPIVVRAYKKEAEMEVWKRNASGQYALLKTFPICRWSGQLGPKTREGDRQAPEGFYAITPGQMNPNSNYYLSFDVGYPNAVDRAKGGTGRYIMVHGTCSSSGCFAMTDASMAELYSIARESFSGGQRAFQFQSYPFRMTASNMAKFRNDANAPFWKNLKEGSDYFEALRDEPRVAACGTRYAFGGADVAAGSCNPSVDPAVAQKRDGDNRQIAELVARGTAATRVVYEDGDQNPVFRRGGANSYASLSEDASYTAADYSRHDLGDVSRPESLMAGPREVQIDAKGKAVMVADAGAAPGPTRAAAAALAKGEPAASEPAKPARVTVADADGDPSAYRKVLGGILGKPQAPATPAAEAATVPASEPAPAKASANASTKAKPAPHGKDAARDTAKDKAPGTKPQAALAAASKHN